MLRQRCETQNEPSLLMSRLCILSLVLLCACCAWDKQHESICIDCRTNKPNISCSITFGLCACFMPQHRHLCSGLLLFYFCLLLLHFCFKRCTCLKCAGAATGLLLSTFALVFAAEWGDKSFLATIALSAASSPVGVVTGAVAGHGVATLIAVLGGSVLGQYLNERVVQYVGGSLFLVFAGATAFDIFRTMSS